VGAAEDRAIGDAAVAAVRASAPKLFAAHAAPSLRLMPTDYESATLCEHYALAQPPSQFAPTRPRQHALAAASYFTRRNAILRFPPLRWTNANHSPASESTAGTAAASPT
jgi:hypothetical protein